MLELGGHRSEAALPSRQGRLLFAYLALHRDRAATRHELMEALWPYTTPAGAPSALTVLVSKVRALLGGEILSGRSELRLNLPLDTRIDVEDALAAVHEAQSAAALGDWKRAWAPALRAQFIAARPLERAARRLLERSPLRETGYTLLMEAQAAQGNIAEAMRVYDHARRTLDRELGITPGRAIQDAHARLLGISATAP